MGWIVPNNVDEDGVDSTMERWLVLSTLLLGISSSLLGIGSVALFRGSSFLALGFLDLLLTPKSLVSVGLGLGRKSLQLDKVIKRVSETTLIISNNNLLQRNIYLVWHVAVVVVWNLFTWKLWGQISTIWIQIRDSRSPMIDVPDSLILA